MNARQKESGRRLFLVARPGGLFAGLAGPGRRQTRRRRPHVPRLFHQRQRRELQPRRPDDRRRPQSRCRPGSSPSKATRAWRGCSSSSIRVELALPLGWQATEDWERGVAYSSDKRYRLIVWRVDFAYEGVKDAEHYAATKAGSIQARRPTVQAQARKLGDGTFLVVYDNVAKAPGRQPNRGSCSTW